MFRAIGCYQYFQDITSVRGYIIRTVAVASIASLLLHAERLVYCAMPSNIDEVNLSATR